MKSILSFGLIVVALVMGWYLRGVQDHETPPKDASNARKVLFYQSAMHPWIKSDKPGRCTICGMELTPVYEGEKGFDATASGDVVALTQNQVQVLHVETAEVKVRPMVKTLRVAGVIDNDDRRHRVLSAYIDSRIDKLFANHIGAEVAKGEPLALIYSPALLQAERDYRQLTGELKSSTGLRLKQMGLSEAQIIALDKKSPDALTSEILSPLTGTILERSVYEGQYVKAGEKLFEIADFSVMWFMFRAYEQDMPWIRIGQEVEVTTPSVPGKIFIGKVTFIDPNFDQQTRSTQVRVELANPVMNGKRELLNSLYADGSVKVETPEVLTVPKSAVIETGPQAVVYVEQGDGAYLRRVVQMGRHGDVFREILAGVKSGDRVVTNGNLLLDGQAEMNRSFMTPVVDALPPPAASHRMGAAQQAAMNEFLKVADSMAAALSSDDLAAFNVASEPAMMRTGALVDALRLVEGQSPELEALEKVRHFHGFADLLQARTAFYAFTAAATAVLEPMRALEGVPPFEVWECSMADDAIPGVPKGVHWIQTGGRPGHNPFFGGEMLECAKSIEKGVKAP